MELRGRIYLINIVMIYCFVQTCFASGCEKKCRSCLNITRCGPGIASVLDKCGCCKICPKQLHEECDSDNPCDVTKNLYCSFSEPGGGKGVCAATPGRSCFIDGNVYLNGQSFSRGSRYSCTCYDSDIMCRPACPTIFRMFKNCANLRLIRKTGKSCEELVCSKFRTYKKVDIESSSTPELAKGPKPLMKSTTLRSGCPTRRPTTRWSPCSKSCGWGISYRHKIKKNGCRSVKEIRLCQVRHCKKSATKIKFQQKKARREIRRVVTGSPVRYSFLGCKSKIYVPRYCSASCFPKRTKTLSVSFLCKNGKAFKKQMMQIKSCKCARRNTV